nr:hypothetical protein [Kibdelosporangium sp. MJ126-NF4]CEL17550.1 hypothetical protein [Kibdelosporangium sp. MJ126-NF4]CTQ91224.1 hypothetical protein [Kibdelosporangium sp. MJ126-NF4]
MLTVTEAAADAIRNMSERCGVLDGGGLRLEVAPHHPEGELFALSLATAPSSEDTVLAVRRGANVFMFPEAASHLSDKILDVRVADGKIKFRLLRRG